MAPGRPDRRLGWLVGLAVGLAVVTSHRVAQWQDHRALWSAAAQVDPLSPQTLLMTAIFQWSDHDLPHARQTIDRAASIVTDPHRPERSPLRTLILRWQFVIHGSS